MLHLYLVIWTPFTEQIQQMAVIKVFFQIYYYLNLKIMTLSAFLKWKCRCPFIYQIETKSFIIENF